MPCQVRPARPRDGVVRMAAEEMLILLQQERTHPEVIHAGQRLASGQSCNPVIGGQMGQNFHDYSRSRPPSVDPRHVAPTTIAAALRIPQTRAPAKGFQAGPGWRLGRNMQSPLIKSGLLFILPSRRCRPPAAG